MQTYTGTRFGEGKRRNEFAEWYVAWLAESHNYAEFNIRSWMISRIWADSIPEHRVCIPLLQPLDHCGFSLQDADFIKKLKRKPQPKIEANC